MSDGHSACGYFDADAPAQVRNPEATGTGTEPGPFMRSALPVAGLAVIEDAVQMMSGTPGAVAHGVVEVWPLQ